MVISLVKLSASGVGFAGARREVTHGDLESQPIAEYGLQALLPQACPTAVAATCVGQDQQLLGRRKGCLALVLPPAGNRVDRKGWRVSRGANVDRPAVGEHVVDGIGQGSSPAVARDTM